MEICPQMVAYALVAAYEAQGEMSPARDWLERVVDLPFAGLTTPENMVSIVMAASGRRWENMVNIALDGLADAWHEAMEVEAMEGAGAYYEDRLERSTAPAPVAARAEDAA